MMKCKISNDWYESVHLEERICIRIRNMRL
jgi:hypothetical protein